MRCRVLLFAALRERAGLDELELVLDGDAARVRDVRAAVLAKAPRLDGQLFRIAVDARYAAESDPVPDGAEVALIPPVSGG